MFKFLLSIFKDQLGLWPWVLPAVGGLVAGGLLGQDEGEEEVYDPYGGMRQKWQDWLTGKIGTSTPYADNPAFNLDKPEAEAATESTILGKLGNLPKLSQNIQGIYGRYEAAQKAKAAERQAEEMRADRERYNRLGLVSSTPGLQSQQELGRKHATEMGLIEAETAKEGVAAEMAATQLAENIANMWASQGQILGGKQRGYQQWGKQMSLEDLIRMTQEEMGYGAQAGGVLGANAPQRSYSPSFGEQILGLGSDILPYLLLMGMTGGIGGAGGGAGGGASGIARGGGAFAGFNPASFG